MAANQFGGPGGTIGSVYTGQQGVDRAVVLGEADDSLAAFTSLINDQQKLKAEEKKAAADAKKEAEKKRPGAESWWIQHDAEMTGRANELMTFGGQLMAAGVDPLNGTTPEALKYRTELDLFDQDAKMSQQVKDMYIKEKAVIDGDKEGKYTQESKNNLLAWFSQHSLKEIKEKGLLPPNLEIAKPDFNRTKFYGEFVKDINLQNPDPSDADLFSFIGQTMSDPAAKEYVMTLQADVNNIKTQSPQYFAALEKEAKDLGVSVEQYIGKQQLQTYFKKEPFDITKAMTNYLPKAHIESSTSTDVSGTKRWSDVKTIPDERLSESAKTFLTMNPDAYPYLVETTKNLPEKDRVVNLETAEKWVKTYMKNQIETYKKTGLELDKEGFEGTGKTQEELKKDHDEWRLGLVGKRGKTDAEKKKAQQNAFDFIRGTKTEEGYDVVDVYQPGAEKVNIFGTGLEFNLLNEEQKAELGKGRTDLLVMKVKIPAKTSEKQENSDGSTILTQDVDKYKYVIYDMSANPKVDPGKDIKSFTASASNPFYIGAVKAQKKKYIETLGEDVSANAGAVFPKKEKGKEKEENKF
jgi:hypothetical protein